MRPCLIRAIRILITHRQVDLLRQRIYGLALGYEDLNDHETLRRDLAWQTALERDTDWLAARPCRLEQRADRKAAVAFHQVLVREVHRAPLPKRPRS